jgi:carboxymethylenebutenolidase
MCDDLIHQGLIHDPTVSRRAFGLGAAAAVILSFCSSFGAGGGR